MKRKIGFTLAEVLITLTILGITVGIVIPSVMKNYDKTLKKTKIKKAMATYDNAINQITVLQRIYNAKDLNNYANEDGQCTNLKTYFKTVKSNGCKFKTPDGVYWDFTKANKPIVAFKEKDLKTQTAYNVNNYDAFYFVTAFQNNDVKINDPNYKQGTLNYVDIFDTNAVIGWGYTLPVRKLWNFLGKYEFPDYTKYSANCQGSTKISCTKCTKSGSDTTCKTYNENGTQVLSCTNYNSATGKCKTADVNGYHCYDCDKSGLNGSTGYMYYNLNDGFKVQVGLDGNGIMNNKVNYIAMKDNDFLTKCDVSMKCTGCYRQGSSTNNCALYKKTDENGKVYYSPN